MSWAKDVMAIGPELEQIAGRPVALDEWDYGWSVTCGIDGKRGIKLARSQYLDPNDGNWYLMDSKVRDHLNEAQLETIVTKQLSVADAQQQLREFVRATSTNSTG